MANDRITTHCPSCEATVAVRTASVGKKIECPKCKFRFVVSDGGGGAKSEKVGKETTADKPDSKKKGGKSKAKSSGGNSKVLIGVLVGVLALGGLGVGAMLIFSGDDKPVEKAGGSGGSQRPRTQSQQPADDTTDSSVGEGGAIGGDPPAGDPPAGGEQPANTANPPPVRPRLASTGVDVTNLLPNDARSVLHVRMDEVKKTPLRNAFFDKANQDLIERSLKIKYGDLAEVVHCYVGQDRTPFIILRTNVDLEEKIISRPHMDTDLPPGSPIKRWHYRVYNSNPFVTAVGRAVNFAELLGVTVKSQPEDEGRKYAVSLYDSRTLIIGENATLQRFLTDLGDDGFPPFRTEYKPLKIEDPVDPNAEPPADGTGSGEPGGPVSEGGPGGTTQRRPGGPPPGVGGPPGPSASGGSDDRRRQMGSQQQPGGGGSDDRRRQMGSQQQPGGGSSGAPGGTSAPPRPGTRRPLTSNPSFRTVEPILKKALNHMQDESTDAPAVLFVTMLDRSVLSRYDLGGLLPRPFDELAATHLAKVRVAGASISKLDEKNGSMIGYLDYVSDDAAKAAVTDAFKPALAALQLFYAQKFNEGLTVRDMNQIGTDPSGFSGGPGGGFGAPAGGPFGPAGPGSGPGGPGGRPGPSTPTGPAGPSGGPGGGPGGSSPDPDAGSQRGRQGGQDDDIQGKGGMLPQGPPSGGVGGVGSPDGGGPGFPGEGGPGFPGQGGSPGFPTSGLPGGSRIDLFQSDTVVTFACELTWKRDAYVTIVESPILRTAALVRGKIALLSGESTLQVFADGEADGRKEPGVLSRMLATKGQFPQGASERSINDNRRGLQYPPDQRCSFIVELLPFMGERAVLHRQIESRTQPWYSTNNLLAAEAWIPELLVPSYPQSAWRATNDQIPDGRTVGATNYVGVAGLSLDAARFDPQNPGDAKRVGLTGYGWGSKPAEVTDGLANTMYMIQVPPGMQRPWIAGGGATLMGVNDRGDDPAQPFMVRRSDGSRGTTVLMGDGSIRTVREGIDPAVFRALSTRAGGETIPDFEKIVPKATPPGAAELKASK